MPHLKTNRGLDTVLQFPVLAIWRWTPTEDTLTWYGQAAMVFGFAVSRVSSYEGLRQFIHPEDRAQIDQKLKLCLASGGDYEAKFRLAQSGGAEVWIAARGGVLQDAAGQVVSLTGVYFDITEMKTAKYNMRDSERRFRELANAMPQIVWTANAQGKLEYYNDRWYDFTGLAADEAPDELDSKQFIHPDDYDRWLSTWVEAVESGLPTEVEYRFRDRRTGHYRWHVRRAVPICDSGQVIGWVGTYTDTHELKEAELSLQDSLAEKDVLLREVHHRVKNNMQIISSLLSMQASTVEHPETVAKLQDSARRVESMALIHEQLYGNEQMSSIDFCEYVRNLTQNLLASCGRGQLTQSILDLSPTQLTVDQAIPCGLILNELITNSLKYAYPAGGAGEITIRLLSNAGHTEMAVSDRGAGLPTAFDLTKAKSLGLKIIRVLAKQLKGEFEVGAGPGAFFKIRFPTDFAGHDPADTRSGRILIAEASDDSRFLLQAYLKNTLYQLTFAENGEHAVQMARSEQFDLILMAIQMPLMDGLTATKLIRDAERQGGRSPVPVLALTANADRKDIEESRAAGCSCHVFKPISKAELLNTIAQYIQRTDAGAKPGWLPIDVPPGLEAAAKRYIQTRKDEVPRLIQCLADRNFDQLRILAHNLKGTGTSYGFPDLTRLGGLMESSSREQNAGALSEQLLEFSKYIQDASGGETDTVIS
jgi:PAS domain S-box-containing protein